MVLDIPQSVFRYSSEVWVSKESSKTRHDPTTDLTTPETQMPHASNGDGMQLWIYGIIVQRPQQQIFQP